MVLPSFSLSCHKDSTTSLNVWYQNYSDVASFATIMRGRRCGNILGFRGRRINSSLEYGSFANDKRRSRNESKQLEWNI